MVLFFSHIAPKAVEIETDVSSMSILEENMELFKYHKHVILTVNLCYYDRHSCNINITVKFK